MGAGRPGDLSEGTLWGRIQNQTSFCRDVTPTLIKKFLILYKVNVGVTSLRTKKEDVTMNCPNCKIELKNGRTVLTFNMGSNRILVVKDVPALICEQCGEESLDLEVSKNVEKQVEKALLDGISMGFIDYYAAA